MATFANIFMLVFLWLGELFLTFIGLVCLIFNFCINSCLHFNESNVIEVKHAAQ